MGSTPSWRPSTMSCRLASTKATTSCAELSGILASVIAARRASPSWTCPYPHEIVLSGDLSVPLLRSSVRGFSALEHHLAQRLAEQMSIQTGHSPSPAERRSWERSFPALRADLVDAGLHDVEMLVEHQHPLTSKRADVVLAGVRPLTGHPLDAMPESEVIGSHHALWQIEASFQMSKTDLRQANLQPRWRLADQRAYRRPHAPGPESWTTWSSYLSDRSRWHESGRRLRRSGSASTPKRKLVPGILIITKRHLYGTRHVPTGHRGIAAMIRTLMPRDHRSGGSIGRQWLAVSPLARKPQLRGEPGRQSASPRTARESLAASRQTPT